MEALAIATAVPTLIDAAAKITSAVDSIASAPRSAFRLARSVKIELLTFQTLCEQFIDVYNGKISAKEGRTDLIPFDQVQEIFGLCQETVRDLEKETEELVDAPTTADNKRVRLPGMLRFTWPQKEAELWRLLEDVRSHNWKLDAFLTTVLGASNEAARCSAEDLNDQLSQGRARSSVTSMVTRSEVSVVSKQDSIGASRVDYDYTRDLANSPVYQRCFYTMQSSSASISQNSVGRQSSCATTSQSSITIGDRSSISVNPIYANRMYRFRGKLNAKDGHDHILSSEMFAEISTKYVKLQEEKEAACQERKQTEIKLQISTDQNTRLFNELETLEKDKMSLQESGLKAVAGLKKQIGEMGMKIRMMEHSMEEMNEREDQERLKSEIRLQIASNQNTELTQENDRLKSGATEAKEAIDMMSHDLEVMKRDAVHKRKQFEIRVQAASEQVTELAQENNSLRESALEAKTQFSKQVADLGQTIDLVRHEIETTKREADQERKQYKVQITELTRGNTCLKQSSFEAATRFNKQQAEMGRKIVMLGHDLKAKEREVNREKKESEARLRLASDRIATLESGNKKLTMGAQERNAEYEKKIGDLEDELEDTIARFKKQIEQLETMLKDTVYTMKHDYDETKKEAEQAIKQLKGRLNRASDEIGVLKADIAHLENEKNSVEQSAVKTKKELSRRIWELEEMVIAQKRDFKERKENDDHDKKHIQHKLQTASEKVTELVDANRSLARSAEKQISRLKQQVSDLEENSTLLKRSIMDQQATVERLEQTKRSLKKDAREAAITFERRIEEMEEENKTVQQRAAAITYIGLAKYMMGQEKEQDALDSKKLAAELRLEYVKQGNGNKGLGILMKYLWQQCCNFAGDDELESIDNRVTFEEALESVLPGFYCNIMLSLKGLEETFRGFMDNPSAMDRGNSDIQYRGQDKMARAFHQSSQMFITKEAIDPQPPLERSIPDRNHKVPILENEWASKINWLEKEVHCQQESRPAEPNDRSTYEQLPSPTQHTDSGFESTETTKKSTQRRPRVCYTVPRSPVFSARARACAMFTVRRRMV